MASIKESDEKPDIADFKLGKAVGEGNFSRIMLATHTASGEVFALKVIEKQRIKRLRVRHPNIFNEINMEKQVLNKLRHPNIIRLYHTFQDEANLYFLLEYVEGGELLNRLVHEGNHIGVHEDLARFYLADMVNAIEFMHMNQVIHRDLKPENMVINAVDGHLKFIDFGTAKDIGEPALNGPHFVGTPEYMSPETVDNKNAEYGSDIWSLGCIAFQLLAGETPFSGGSAYLTFLKVQIGRYHLPSFVSDAARDLIQKCLAKDPASRPTIHEVKAHPFFEGVDFAAHMATAPPATQFQNASLFELIRDLKEADSQRGAKQLLDACFTDGVQQKIEALDDHNKALLMHLLERKQLLHLLSIYPRFFAHPSLGRCKYARHGGYVGFTHAMQNQWSDKFSFMMIGGPALSVPESPMSWEQLAAEFHRRVIDPINAQMPAFVIFCGDLLAETTNSSNYASHGDQIRLLLNEIHPEIKLVFAAGVETFSVPLTNQDRLIYSEHFGVDKFSFWHGGVKFIVINSPLIAHELDVPDQAKEQEEWLIKELENGKLCAKDTVLVSAHSFHTLVQGPELPPGLTAASTDNNNPHELTDAQKKRYVEILAKHPPRLIITTHGPEDGVITVHTTIDQNASADDDSMPVLKKTQMVVCSSPLSSTRDTVMHMAYVSQSGIAITQVRATNTLSKLQDVDSVLAAEAIKLEVSRASTPTTA